MFSQFWTSAISWQENDPDQKRESNWWPVSPSVRPPKKTFFEAMNCPESRGLKGSSIGRARFGLRPWHQLAWHHGLLSKPLSAIHGQNLSGDIALDHFGPGRLSENHDKGGWVSDRIQASLHKKLRISKVHLSTSLFFTKGSKKRHNVPVSPNRQEAVQRQIDASRGNLCLRSCSPGYDECWPDCGDDQGWETISSEISWYTVYLYVYIYIYKLYIYI